MHCHGTVICAVIRFSVNVHWVQVALALGLNKHQVMQQVHEPFLPTQQVLKKMSKRQNSDSSGTF